MQRLLALPTWLIVALLVGASTLLRFWAGHGVPAPWIAPDELIYGELGRSLWGTGSSSILGAPTRFYTFVYPALIGLPLRLSDLGLGYSLLKLLQAIVMSSTAVPVYLWTRSLAGRGWAIGAASLALALPGLAYSGLLMTEVAFYPVLALAAWAMASALAIPSLRNQALAVAAIVLAVATRLQALVLVPAYATAIALDLFFSRRPRRVRAFAPTLAGVAVAVAGWSAWQLRNGGPASNLLGAYRAAGEISYSVRSAALFALYHAGDLLLLTGVVPVCAVVLVGVPAFAGRERTAAVRAYLAVAISVSAWFVVEVGVFASRHVGRLAERDLLGLAPMLFVGFALWLDRGAPRPRVATALTVAAAMLLVFRLPMKQLVSLAAIPDAFTLIPLYRLRVHAPTVNLDLVVDLTAAACLAGLVAVPRRLRWLLPTALVLAFAGISISASRVVAAQARITRAVTLGTDNRWIDHAAHGSVAYLYSGEVYWNSVWESVLWNRRVDRVYDLLSAQVPGPIPQPSVGPMEDGRVVLADGRPARADYVVASRALSFAGRPVASAAGPGLVLWRLRQPVRLASWIQAVRPREDLYLRAKIYVYGCRGGGLDVTLTATAPTSVLLQRNERPLRTIRLAAGQSWNGAIPAVARPPLGRRQCTFGLFSDRLVHVPRLRIRRE